jgi:hypothetical protein
MEDANYGSAHHAGEERGLQKAVELSIGGGKVD